MFSNRIGRSLWALSAPISSSRTGLAMRVTMSALL
jgi:hypothetical protein